MLRRGTQARRHKGTKASARRRGFSFAEVMFAVIILGVGFIMIAALFPVAIRQSKSTADETSAAAFARVANNDMAAMATNSKMPLCKDSTAIKTGIAQTQVFALPTRQNSPTFPDVPPTTSLWQSVRGNIISSNDPRYAWVPFYFRDTDITGNTQPYAQLILICVQATNASTFVDADVNPTPATNWANLRGRPVAIKVANGDDTLGDPDLIGFEDSQLNATTILPGAVSAVAEGCFVIVRADTGNGGRLTGQVYRVGARRPEKDGQTVNSYSDLTTDPPKTVNFTGMQVWELAPGNDFQIVRDLYQNPPVVYAIDQPTEAWIMGRSFASPNYTGAAPTFDGPAMDVSFYSTFVFCKP